MKLYAADLNYRPLAEEFDVPTDFSLKLRAEAKAATDRFADSRRDARDLELVTIDPPGSRDLDQAVHIERTAAGFRVHYAIADVAAFITPGSALEKESFLRGQTIYLPDEPARLHPAEISEGSASLLPNVDRPAVLWTFEVDESGEVSDTHVERALVRSRERLDYEGVHVELQMGDVHPSIAYLPEVGRAREQSSLRREAVNLRLPSQRVVRGEDGRYELIIEPRPPVMDYNSEVSLLTGMMAGQMMQSAGHGLLRTLKPATPDTEAEFRAEARALGFVLDEHDPIGAFLVGVDADTPRGMALMREAQSLLRGSGYGEIENGDSEVHAGVGGFYAHVTAPLRRLVDRFATEHCLAISGGYDVPQWVLERHEAVLESMQRTGNLASNVDRAALDLTEATVLEPWIGHNFSAVVLRSNQERATSRIFVSDPPVLTSAHGAPAVGTEVQVSLVHANPVKRTTSFAWPAD